MEKSSNLTSWRDDLGHLLDPLRNGVSDLAADVAGALLILLVGWGLARGAQVIVRRALARLGTDRLTRRAKVNESLERAGIDASLSSILARATFWLLMAFTLLIAVDTLEVRALTATIDRFLEYVPRIFGAAILLLVGLVVGRITRNVIASGAAFGTSTDAARLAGASNVTILVAASILALQQLGVDTQLLASVATALIGAMVLSMGIAFALGARAVVSHILAGHFLRQRFQPGQTIELDQLVGVIERVGAVDTLIEHGEHTSSIPNATLLEKPVTLGSTKHTRG